LFVTPILAALTAALPGLAQRARAVAMAAQFRLGPFSQPDGCCSPISFRPYFAFRVGTRSAG
jgi:hypothetical protein